MPDPTARADGRSPLFSFVVVADTHVNEAEDTSTSPFETNHLANPRARHVFAEIAAMRPPPSFVVHLGDIVHPVPSLPAFHDAVGNFKAIASQLPVPLHVVPGNHDVGDKTVDWMPAEQVCDDYLATYREAFGADFHAFDENGVRFVMLNSLLLNSGLADEARQRAWLEERIDSAGDLRVFLFMHYPPYIHRPDEAGNYDNVDEPARAWLLAQIAKPAVEAVFAGHVHNFWYDRAGEAEMYLLPSTAFLRHDFSEFCLGGASGGLRVRTGRRREVRLVPCRRLRPRPRRVRGAKPRPAARAGRDLGRASAAPSRPPEDLGVRQRRGRAPASLGRGHADHRHRRGAGVRPQVGAQRLPAARAVGDGGAAVQGARRGRARERAAGEDAADGANRAPLRGDLHRGAARGGGRGRGRTTPGCSPSRRT